MIDDPRIQLALHRSRILPVLRTTVSRAGSAFAAWLELNADPAERDEAVERLVASSHAGRALGSVVSAFERGWPDSRCGRIVRQIAVVNDTSTTAQKVCLGATITMAAGVTAVVLRLLSTHADPLTWLMPSAAVVAAALALAAVRRHGKAGRTS